MRKPHPLTLVLGALVASALIAPVGTATARASVGTSPQVPATVRVGTPVTATGVVPGHRRLVQLQQHFGTGWRKVARGYSTRSGAVAFPVNTGWYGPRTFRFFAPKFHHHKKWVSRSSVMQATPTYTPAGSRASHRFLGKARWNPCKPVPWVYIPGSFATHAPITGDGASFTDMDAHAFALVQAAVAEVSRATGVSMPFAGRAATYQRRKGVIQVGWTDDPRGSQIPTGSSAIGVPFTTRSRTGVPEIVAGVIVMDTTAIYDEMTRLAETPGDPGFDANGYVWGPWLPLAEHEFGHTFGLAHVPDPTQLMTNDRSDGPVAQYGAGDLAGLYLKGASAGCVPGSRR